ncbi:hypothetical protein LCGC14_0992240 [marine sediment metagenome]|uniref:Uncharacterized protein n=1 Tax=marine sediment metagenome TaxID=412755 RepID=A0A0F9N5I8_9ZZZZ
MTPKQIEKAMKKWVYESKVRVAIHTITIELKRLSKWVERLEDLIDDPWGRTK